MTTDNSNLDDPNCQYAIVQQVQVLKATPDHVTFVTRSERDQPEVFTVAAVDVWACAPAQAPTAVPLTPGAVGNLYLSRTGWAATSASGSRIYKADDSQIILFKWPRCSPFRTIQRLDVTPSQIRIVYDEAGQRLELDLLGPLCADGQAIHWNAAQPITVQLSDQGAQASGGVRTLEVWPRQLIVSGAPDGGTVADVDVLDANLADFTQDLLWSTKHAPITLRLSTVAFGRYDVATESLRSVALGYNVAYGETIVEEWTGFEPAASRNVELQELVAKARLRCGSRSANDAPPSAPCDRSRDRKGA